MKKKIMMMVLAVSMTTVSLAGCGSKELSNEYVTVKQYRGLEVPKVSETEVTDEMVEQMIQSSLAGTAEKVTVSDRAAQTGDWVNIDFTGYLDGEAFDGGSAQGQDLQLGAGGFIGASGDYEGFEDQIVGHQTGEEFDITVQFPEEYRSAEMAGQVATFHIVLNEIFEENIPELTDDWVLANSTEAENVEGYRTQVRKDLEEQYAESAREQLESYVQDELLENLDIKGYPEDFVKEQAEEMEEYYTQMATMYGVELPEFITTYLNTTEEDFDAKINETAQQTAIITEAVKLIAEKHKLEPSEKEYEEKMKEYAEQAGMTDVEAYKEQVGEDILKRAILVETVTDFLADECVQVEDSDSDE